MAELGERGSWREEEKSWKGKHGAEREMEELLGERKLEEKGTMLDGGGKEMEGGEEKLEREEEKKEGEELEREKGAGGGGKKLERRGKEMEGGGEKLQREEEKKEGEELERERGSWKGREGVGVGKLNCVMEQNPTIQIPTERRGQ